MSIPSPSQPPHRAEGWKLGLRLSVGLMLGVAISGCTRPEQTRQVITYSFWGTPEQQKTEQAVIHAFEAAHPGTQVIPQVVPGGSLRYNDKLQAMFVGQTAPDVIMIEMARYDDWASRNVLDDASGDVDAQGLMPVPRQAFERDGRFYAAPINCHGYATYYNQNALAAVGMKVPAAGWTWEGLLARAPALSRRAGAKHALTDYAFQLPSPIVIFWAFGGSLFDNLHHPHHATVNSAGGRAAIGYLRRALATGAVLPPNVGGLAADSGTYELFRDGQIALFFSGRWQTPNFMGITKFTWDVAPIPRGPARRITQHGGTALGVWKGSQHKKLAHEFVRFYASPAGAEITMQSRRYVPVYRQLAFSPEYLRLTPPEHLVVFSQTMEQGAALTYLYAPGFSAVQRIFDEAMVKAMLRPDIPADKLLADLEQELNIWLQRR